MNSLNIFSIADQDLEVSDNVFCKIQAWNSQTIAFRFGAICVRKVKFFQPGNFKDVVKVGCGNVDNSFDGVDFCGSSTVS